MRIDIAVWLIFSIQPGQQLKQQHVLHNIGKGAYPGSPWFALEGMREIDKATIFEMQRDVFQQLRHNIFDKRAGLHERDAYEGLLGVIPPKEKRGLVMIDPPYELERKDFPQLVELLVAAYKKWPTGVFAVWYPIKDRAMIERFEKKMYKTGIRRQLGLRPEQALLQLDEICYSRTCKPVLCCQTCYTDFFDFAMVRKLI
jgi:23S rRNA A2030 N6-methylase RlmJ